MIGTIDVRCNAAKPNFPLQPLFAFQGSPSSLRILDVPKSIGNWAITSVKVAVAYPDNTTVEKSAVRSGSVWVATVEGCDVAGKVSNGYEVIADGKDEDGNDVTGYVLGKGDVYVIENSIDISRLLDKIAVRYIEDIPDVPTKGDLMNSNGELRLFDGIDWIVISTGGNNGVYDSQITIQKNGTSVGSFTVNASEPKSIDIPVPSNTSDLNNDIGYITASAVSASYYNKGEIDTSLAGKRGIHDDDIHPTSVTNTPFYKVRVDYTDISQEKMTVVLEKQNGSQMVWLWQDNGQEIELTYSDGYFQLSYQNITDLNNTPHSSFFGDFEITNPDELVTIGDSYFRFNLSTYGGTYASQEWVEADVASLIPSNISSFNNDVGYITANALPTKTSDLTNDSGFITLAQVPTPSFIQDSNGNKIEADLDYEIHNPTSTNWTLHYPHYFGQDVILEYSNGAWRYEGTNHYPEHPLQEKVTLEYNNNTWSFYTWYYDTQTSAWIVRDECSFNDGERAEDITFVCYARITRTMDDSGKLATKGEIPIKVGELQNDVGYLTTSSNAFTAKRDKTDMSAVVGTTYASWNLWQLHTNTYSPALELKWGTYNVFGQEQECWLVDDEYRQVCFFLLPELNMLYWGVRNQDGSYIAGYGETITLSSDELSIATIDGVAEITCSRESKTGTPEVSTIATMKDLQGFQNINELRNWWDNTCPASIDTSGRYTINTFSVVIGSNSFFLDQFSKSGSTSTWKGSGNYPTITTTDGLNFVLNSDSDTMAYFTISDLKPGPAKGTIGGSNFNVYANFKLTTYAMKDYVDDQIGNVLTEQF